MSKTQTRTDVKRLGRVVIAVADEDKAVGFYVGKLGFERFERVVHMQYDVRNNP
jgi:catechol 2,3-dioxygenase-like lactoylglutathione lyase family enzyme